MKRKVLFLITKATWGGAQRYVFDLATHLPKNEFVVVVAYGQKGKLADDLTTGGIVTRQLPSLARDIAFLSDVASFFQIIRCIRETKPDVVHLNSSKAAALGALAAHLCGIKKIVFTVHGWPFKEHRSELMRMLIYFISWLTASLSSAVIVVSGSDETMGKEMRWIGHKVHYVPIGVEPPEFLSREEASAKLSITANKPRIVTIAELTPNKGIGYAIEAIAELRRRNVDVDYFLIGNGEERHLLGDFATQRGVADRVHFLDFIPDASRYLKAFDVFILPSIKEGMPYVLLEAAMAGLPLISTDVVDPTFLTLSLFSVAKVPPRDANAIADAVSEMLKQPGKPLDIFSPLMEMIERTVAFY